MIPRGQRGRSPTFADPPGPLGRKRRRPEADPLTDPSRAASRRQGLDVARVASGNFLEMYDFMVFGYFAAAIGRAYFPGGETIDLAAESAGDLRGGVS